MGRTNYGACMGDSVHRTNYGAAYTIQGASKSSNIIQSARISNRGFFNCQFKTAFRDVLDGLSNTIAMGEFITDLGDDDKRSRHVNGTTGATGKMKYPPLGAAPQLYNLNEDPGENVHVAVTNPIKVRALRALLDEWYVATERQADWRHKE